MIREKIDRRWHGSWTSITYFSIIFSRDASKYQIFKKLPTFHYLLPQFSLSNLQFFFFFFYWFLLFLKKKKPHSIFINSHSLYFLPNERILGLQVGVPFWDIAYRIERIPSSLLSPDNLKIKKKVLNCLKWVLRRDNIHSEKKNIYFVY